LSSISRAFPEWIAARDASIRRWPRKFSTSTPSTRPPRDTGVAKRSVGLYGFSIWFPSTLRSNGET
jgi:hypothetical protein